MVPTRAEITRPGPPVTLVNVGPGVSNSAGTVVVGGSDGNRGGNVMPPGAVDVRQVGANGYDTGARTASGAGGRSLADEAARVGETLVGPDGQPLRANTPLPLTVVNNGNGGSVRMAQPLTGGMKQYKAEVGDSLSKLALKQMGANSKANRDAIVKANPSLAADPNKIIIGVTYNIPAAVAATPALAGGNVAPPVVVPAAPRTPEHTTPSVAENVYVVQPGDNLSRIAKDHMGDITTIAAIKELNKDLVKNWDVLPVGTKLRLPGKPLASAQ
jgi:LysM repeat protein